MISQKWIRNNKLNQIFYLGSIVAWVTKPENGVEQEVLSLPDGWVECDGEYENYKLLLLKEQNSPNFKI